MAMRPWNRALREGERKPANLPTASGIDYLCKRADNLPGLDSYQDGEIHLTLVEKPLPFASLEPITQSITLQSMARGMEMETMSQSDLIRVRC